MSVPLATRLLHAYGTPHLNRDFSHQQSGDVTTGNSPYTFSSVSVGAPNLRRWVVVSFAWRSNVISSVTIGSVAATEIIQRQETDAGSFSAAIFAAKVPSGDTVDIVVEMVVGSVAWMSYAVYTLNSQIALIAHDTAFQDGTGSVISTTIDLPANGTLIAAMADSDAASADVTWLGATERYEYSDSPQSDNSGHADADGLSSENGRVVSYETSSGSFTGVLVAASF